MSCTPHNHVMLTYRFICILLGVNVVLLLPLMATNAISQIEDEEFLLKFDHPAMGSYYISAIYSQNKVYLPLSEIFSLLHIHQERGETSHSIRGTFKQPDNHWYINPVNMTARIGKENINLTVKDLRMGEMDIFLSPAVYKNMFGLQFTVIFNTLNLKLESDHILPIEELRGRENLRREFDSRNDIVEDYPLRYPRSRNIIGAGMIDYNFGINASSKLQTYNYTLTGGMEFFGGDFQGSLMGNHSGDDIMRRITGLSWRFVTENNPYLTSIRTGQLSTTGLYSKRIIGGALSNDPVMPRRVYETYVIDGYTISDSEVELYVNNQLADYSRADELGYYRFDYPLNYGTVRISLRIFTPAGEVIIEEKQMQIPFTFLPKGVLAYNIQGGIVDDDFTTNYSGNLGFHGDMAFGVAKGITAKIGVDFFSHEEEQMYYGSISARLFGQYLLNIDVAPDALYRATTSVTFASNRSFNMAFTHFDGTGVFNRRGASQAILANLYVPFRLRGTNAGFRLGADHTILGNTFNTNYWLDLNSRVGRMNMRFNYRGKLAGSLAVEEWLGGLMTTAATFNFSRNPEIPLFVRGSFLRLQVAYNTEYKKWINAGMQVSRTVTRSGRLTVNINYDFHGNAINIKSGFTIDLQPVRSNTHVVSQGGKKSLLQNFNGSFGFDEQSGQILAGNRSQVGQSAASVVMFIDDNENGRLDTGEKIIPAKAIRLDHSGNMSLGDDNILRVEQLQSYWSYNADIVQTALPDPTLSPLYKKFSFVTDPNRYKRIEIPMYRTGIIDGNVKIANEDNTGYGVGGVRLLLSSDANEHLETLRTFSDGSFYEMGLIPGSYKLEIDPIQLDYMDKSSCPPVIIFEVKPTADGDFIENLDFMLITKDIESLILSEYDEMEIQLRQKLSGKVRKHLRNYVAAQKEFYNGNYQLSLNYVNVALGMFETDHLTALKGSILYMMGETKMAYILWEEASRRNPEIIIPDKDDLEMILMLK